MLFKLLNTFEVITLVPVDFLIQYEGLLHMEIERRLVKEKALAVIAGLLELGDSQELPKKWYKLSK